MSKCQRSKFFAGGKACAGGGSSGAGSTRASGPNNLDQNLSALLAARDAQDKLWTTPATAEGHCGGPPATVTQARATPALTQLAIVSTQPVNHKQMSKEEMMKIICSGDMSDED